MGKNEAANSSMIPPLAAAIWQKGEERNILHWEDLEANFTDEDSNDETFDCVYDLDIIPDSENEGDSESHDLDIQI